MSVERKITFIILLVTSLLPLQACEDLTAIDVFAMAIGPASAAGEIASGQMKKTLEREREREFYSSCLDGDHKFINNLNFCIKYASRFCPRGRVYRKNHVQVVTNIFQTNHNKMADKFNKKADKIYDLWCGS